MGLIADILKKPRKRLPVPQLRINLNAVKSDSDKEHFATIQRLGAKPKMTNQEKKAYRRAVKVLRDRSILQLVTEEDDDNT